MRSSGTEIIEGTDNTCRESIHGCVVVPGVHVDLGQRRNSERRRPPRFTDRPKRGSAS